MTLLPKRNRKTAGRACGKDPNEPFSLRITSENGSIKTTFFHLIAPDTDIESYLVLLLYSFSLCSTNPNKTCGFLARIMPARAFISLLPAA